MTAKIWLIALAILTVPTVAADTADIPELTVNPMPFTYRFIAAWLTNDGASITVGGTLFYSMFGDSSPRTTETDQLAQAPFSFNMTNFRVSAGLANCGGLGVGQNLAYIVRVNQVNSILQGNCTFGAAQHSFTLDTDIVQVNVGDRLTISVTLTGGVTAVGPRVGLSLEGYVNSLTGSGTTVEVVDMVNELLEVVNLTAPILFMLLALIWAEASKEYLIHILAALAGSIAVLSIWTEIESLRIILVATTFMILARAYFTYRTENETENE